jgi:hypothetical protein
MQAPTDKIDIPTIRKIKESAKLTLKEQFGIPKSVPLFALVAIKDEALRNFILDGLSAIGIAHVALIPEAQTPSTS